MYDIHVSMPSSSITAAVALTAVCTVAVGGLLAAERRASQRGKWIFKPIAALAFVGVALALGGADTTYGRAVIAALVLSLGGDLLLIPKGKTTFLLGLGSFLCGHAGYAVAFATRGVTAAPAVITGALLVGAAVPVARWLLPHVERPMRPPVIAYMTVITAMVALAAGTVFAHGRPAILVGAFAFYLSDLSVARDRFVAPGFDNRAWGLPLYFGAQLVLAWTVYTSPP